LKTPHLFTWKCLLDHQKLLKKKLNSGWMICCLGETREIKVFNFGYARFYFSSYFSKQGIIIIIIFIIISKNHFAIVFYSLIFFYPLIFNIWNYNLTRSVFLVLDKPKFFISFYYLNIIENNKNLSSKNIFKYFDFAYVQIS